MILLLPIVLGWCALAGALNSNHGPWVASTVGDVWPKPNGRVLGHEYYLVRPARFVITAPGQTCDIVTAAIARYSGIVVTEGRHAKKYSRDEPVTTERVLDRLELHMRKPCGENAENWPNIWMQESYTLTIDESSPIATVVADSVWGILRGLETFSQLLVPAEDGSLKVRCQKIVDEPHLPHRGLLLDTSRHFIPVPDILLTLDAMAYNKLNVFHWHIVDDNSFPYESVEYPELSAKGAYHKTMVYSQSDIRRVIEYARLRGIRVMPEFDTPGHTRSWGESHPELLTTCYDSAGRPNGKLGPMNPINRELYPFLRRLYSEIIQVFPEQYIHLGGDEVPFDCWASNPQILDYMASHNMSKNWPLLETEFITKLLQITTSLNAKTVVWQEVFDNGVALPSSTAVHVWTGRWQKELELATKAGHPVLLSACWYLDHLLTGGDWKKFYECDPLAFNGSAQNRHLMLGGEACMWSEFVDRNNLHPRVWPRASAAAERLWTRDAEPSSKAARRLEEQACRMNRRGVPAQPPNGPGFCLLLN